MSFNKNALFDLIASNKNKKTTPKKSTALGGFVEPQKNKEAEEAVPPVIAALPVPKEKLVATLVHTPAPLPKKQKKKKDGLITIGFSHALVSLEKYHVTITDDSEECDVIAWQGKLTKPYEEQKEEWLKFFRELAEEDGYTPEMSEQGVWFDVDPDNRDALQDFTDERQKVTELLTLMVGHFSELCKSHVAWNKFEEEASKVKMFDGEEALNPFAIALAGERDWYQHNWTLGNVKYIETKRLVALKKAGRADRKYGNQPYLMRHKLAIKLLEKANLQGTEKIAVIEAIELVQSLVKVGFPAKNITFYSTSLRKRAVAEELGAKTMDAMELLKKHREKNETVENFDVILMNPPYEMYMEFFTEASKIGKQVLSIQPATSLVNRKPVSRAKKVVKFLEVLETRDSAVELFNGNIHFTAAFFTPLSILHISAGPNPEQTVEVSGYYTAQMKLEEMNAVGAWVVKYLELIKTFPRTVQSRENIYDGEFYVNIGRIRGNAPSDRTETYNSDFFTMFPKALKVQGEANKRRGWLALAFDTKEEAQNCLDYLKLRFPRFLLSLYKMNGQLDTGEMAAVPWMDFTRSWTDKELFEHFNVSVEDQKKILEFIPDYYGVSA